MAKFLRPAASLAVVLLLFAAGCDRKQAAPAVPGSPAPAFSLKDMDGKQVQLTDLAGSVVVLDFWATWCDPCKRSMPEYEQLSLRFRDRKVAVIGISLDKGADAPARVRDFAAREKVTYRLLLDDGSAARA